MAEDKKQNTEIDEVQSFGGGDIKSIEPVAEVHHDMHEYSGGEVVELSTTTVSPILWGFWAIVIAGIIGTVIATGTIPGIHLPGKSYGRPMLASNTGYTSLVNSMSSHLDQTGYEAMTNPAYVDMYKLPLPSGQNIAQGISAGTTVYQTYCIGCHGPNQDGNGPNAVSLNPAPRNLRDIPFMQAMSYQRIWTSLHKGVPGTAMPRWENTLSDDQIRDVISYVFSLTAPTDAQGNYLHVAPQAEVGDPNDAGTAVAAPPAPGSAGTPH